MSRTILLADDSLANRNRKVELVLREQVLGDQRQHGARLRVLREGIGELQAAVEVGLVPFRTRCP